MDNNRRRRTIMKIKERKSVEEIKKYYLEAQKAYRDAKDPYHAVVKNYIDSVKAYISSAKRNSREKVEEVKYDKLKSEYDKGWEIYRETWEAQRDLKSSYNEANRYFDELWDFNNKMKKDGTIILPNGMTDALDRARSERSEIYEKHREIYNKANLAFVRASEYRTSKWIELKRMMDDIETTENKENNHE